MSIRRFSIVLAFCSLLPLLALAGSITTREGQTYTGAISVAGADLTIATEQGAKTIPMAAVARATFKTAAAEKPAPGHGLRGEYYSGRAFRKLLLVREDSAIDYHWGEDVLPHPLLCPYGREFSVRWSGQIRAEHSEKYQIIANTDDGVRLWLDGKLIIDHWLDQAAGEISAEVELTAGRAYELRMEYFNGNGPGEAMLLWSSPSTPRQLISTANLLLPPADPKPAQVIVLNAPATDGGPEFQRIIASDSSGLKAEYFSDKELKTLAFIRFDANIDFHFHDDVLPDPGMPPEGSVRWTGLLEVPRDDEYRFHLEAHLNVRLWIDGKLIIDQWESRGGDFSSDYVTLAAGKKYSFKVEYSSAAGFMVCRARWSSKNIGRDVIPPASFSIPTDSRLGKPVIGLVYPGSDSLACAPESLALLAAGLSPNSTVQKVEFFNRNDLFAAVTNQPYRFAWTRPPSGFYTIRAKLTDSLGVTALSDPFSLTVTGKGDGTLKAPWGDFYIANNEYKTPGMASIQNGTFKISKAIGTLTSDNEHDAGHFIIRPLAGDGQIIARIVSVDPRDPNADAMAGVTIRESLKNRCKQTSLMWGVPANDPVVAFVRRQDHWMNPVSMEKNAETPHWVKLVRHGPRVHAYVSPDGQNWELLASDRFETGPNVFVGLVAFCKDKDKPATAIFDNVQVITGSPPLESTAKGFLTRTGSFVAADVFAIDDNVIRYTRDNLQQSLPLRDVARLVVKPLLTDHAAHLGSNRTGALMAGGDFLEGDVKALADGQVSISSVLFGLKKIYVHEDLTALILHDVETVAGGAGAGGSLMVMTADNSTYRTKSIKAAKNDLELEDPTLGTVRIPLSTVLEIRGQ